MYLLNTPFIILLYKNLLAVGERFFFNHDFSLIFKQNFCFLRIFVKISTPSTPNFSTWVWTPVGGGGCSPPPPHPRWILYMISQPGSYCSKSFFTTSVTYLLLSRTNKYVKHQILSNCM